MKAIQKGTLIGISALGLLMAVSACRATVAGDPDRPIKIEAHITLDIRQIKEEARSIEDMVSGGGKPALQKQSWLRSGWMPLAWAEAALSPEVLGAVQSRKERYDRIKSLKGQGLIGEDNQGHVAVLDGGPEVKELAEQENRDRETIYQAQVKQKGLPADAIATIRAAFAQEQRDRAAPGEKIQLPSGEWITK